MLLFSHPVMSESLWPCGLQNMPPCPSPSPEVIPGSCPLLWWCRPAISSSDLPLLLLPSIFPSIRDLPNESAVHIRWPKYRNFHFSISPSNNYSGLISLEIDWFDLLAVHGTVSPTCLDSSLWLIQPGISHNVLSIEIKQTGWQQTALSHSFLNLELISRQPCHTPFSILSWSVVPYRLLTVASWPTYRLLRRQVRWTDLPICLRVFHSLLWSTQPKVLCPEVNLKQERIDVMVECEAGT